MIRTNFVLSCVGIAMMMITTGSSFSTVTQHQNSNQQISRVAITTRMNPHTMLYLKHSDNDDIASITNGISTRRSVVTKSVAIAITTVATTTMKPTPTFASGGATAGRYTTIPIAKRRYYGRVQQAVHEFLDMGTYVVKGDMTNPIIQKFFDVNGVVVVEAKRKDVNGQCTKKNNECKGREVRDSRWNDMKASMYLLANAFRTDQQKPPDRLPTVRAARGFFKEMDEMEKLVKVKNPKTNDVAAIERYAKALNILDIYLDLVELPPTDSGHYNQEFDTLVGETARIT